MHIKCFPLPLCVLSDCEHCNYEVALKSVTKDTGAKAACHSKCHAHDATLTSCVALDFVDQLLTRLSTSMCATRKLSTREHLFLVCGSRQHCRAAAQQVDPETDLRPQGSSGMTRYRNALSGCATLFNVSTLPEVSSVLFDHGYAVTERGVFRSAVSDHGITVYF